MNNEYINIVTSGDRAAYISICALLNSIILNYKTNKKLRIYIVCESAVELNELINRNCYVESLTDKVRQDMATKSNIKLIEPPNNIVEEIINKQSFVSFGVEYINKPKDWGKPISVYNFIRFYFPELLPDSVNKVIYLDTDMIVKCDIEELFNLSDHKYELGAVFCKFPYILTKNNWISPDYLSLLSRNNLFNAGMYITYLDKWRENNYTHQCMSIVEANKFNNFYNGGTQPPMNIVFSHSIQEIPQEWNQTGLGEYKRPVSTEFETYIKNAKILHWTGGMKPWLSKKNDLYTHFAEQWYVYFNKEGVDLASIQARNDVNFKNYVLRLQKNVKQKVRRFNSAILKSDVPYELKNHPDNSLYRVNKYNNIIFVIHGNRSSDILRAKQIIPFLGDNVTYISLFHDGTEKPKENILQELETYKNSLFIWVKLWCELKLIKSLKTDNKHIFDIVDSYNYNNDNINNIAKDNLVDGLIVNNQYMKDYFLNKYNFSGKIYVIPHHSDPNLKTAILENQDKLTFGYMGDIHSLQHTNNFVNYYNLLDNYHIEFFSTSWNCYLTDIVRNITENKGNKYYKIIWQTQSIVEFVDNDDKCDYIIPHNVHIRDSNADNINKDNNLSFDFNKNGEKFCVWKPKNKKYEIIKSPSGIFNFPTDNKDIKAGRGRIKGISNINIKFNCHISIREKESNLFKFKTSAKIATAAYLNHNIITTYEESVKDIMPENYPFILYSIDEESIKKMFNLVINDFNGDKKLWNKGLEIMKKIKKDLSIDNISKKYLEIF